MRAWVMLLVVLIFPLVGPACLGVPAEEGRAADLSQPPSIILILADDIGYEALGSYGGTSYSTPNLDELAASGMLFERAYATPLCTPTRVQLMTGQYNFRNYRTFGILEPGEITFANYLRDAGYATAVSGKWQLGGDEQTPHEFGFDEYLLWQLYPTGAAYWTRYKDPVLTRSGGAREDTLRGRYGPDVELEFVEEFIERHRAGPVFVYWPMTLVHAPFQPPPGHPDYDDHEIRSTNDPKYFGAMVEYMDALVGRLVRRLDELGVRENTLILFVGDNGTHPDIVSRIGGREIRGGKRLTIDAGIRVPMLASWPAAIAPGQVESELVDVVDFLPTLLEVAGVRPRPGFHTDGISFYSAMRTGTPHTRRWIFNDYHPGREGRGPPARWAHDKRYKLYSDGRFFDYLEDPLEQHPLDRSQLSGQAARAKAELQAVLNEMEAEIRRLAAERGTANELAGETDPRAGR